MYYESLSAVFKQILRHTFFPQRHYFFIDYVELKSYFTSYTNAYPLSQHASQVAQYRDVLHVKCRLSEDGFSEIVESLSALLLNSTFCVNCLNVVKNQYW